MERSDSERRRESTVAWTLLVLVILAGIAGLAVAAWTTHVAPLHVAALHRAGVKTLPPHAIAAIRASNFITTKWYFVIPAYAVVLAFLLSRLLRR
ncbi:MAG: hypothetical protein ACE149_18540 [Armatimonadota bacterium]